MFRFVDVVDESEGEGEGDVQRTDCGLLLKSNALCGKRNCIKLRLLGNENIGQIELVTMLSSLAPDAATASTVGSEKLSRNTTIVSKMHLSSRTSNVTYKLGGFMLSRNDCDSKGYSINRASVRPKPAASSETSERTRLQRCCLDDHITVIVEIVPELVSQSWLMSSGSSSRCMSMSSNSVDLVVILFEMMSGLDSSALLSSVTAHDDASSSSASVSASVPSPAQLTATAAATASSSNTSSNIKSYDFAQSLVRLLSTETPHLFVMSNSFVSRTAKQHLSETALVSESNQAIQHQYGFKVCSPPFTSYQQCVDTHKQAYVNHVYSTAHDIIKAIISSLPHTLQCDLVTVKQQSSYQVIWRHYPMTALSVTALMSVALLMGQEYLFQSATSLRTLFRSIFKINFINLWRRL